MPGKLAFNPAAEKGVAGLNVEEFLNLYYEQSNYTKPYGWEYAGPVYDAVWALALALNSTVQKMMQNGKKIKKVPIYFTCDICFIALSS